MYASKSYSYQIFNDTAKPLSINTGRKSSNIANEDLLRAEHFTNTDAEKRIIQLEYELRQTRENFKVFVEELTASIEAAKQAKRIFLDQMSHKLKTPLNGILGFTQILKHDPTLGSSQRHGIEIIHDCGTDLSILINDILHLSNIEAGKLILECSDFHFPMFLENLIAIIRVIAEQKGISFNYQPQSNLPTVIHCDEIHLRQVLLNLLNNAVKFTETGSVDFKVDYENQNITFKIEDTGVGIPADQLAEIFLPFQQSIENRSTNAGVGIGLTISQKIVQLLGGEIQVHSTVGEGSTFWFDLHLPEIKTQIQSPQIQLHPHSVGVISKTPKILETENKNKQLEKDCYFVDNSIIPPSSKEISILLDLAMKGDIRGIIEQAHCLKKLDTKYASFVKEIVRLAESFQELKIIDFLNQYC